MRKKKLTCFISLTASAAILLCSMTGCGKENNSTAEPNPSLTIDENNSSVDSSSEENKADTQSESFSMQIEDVFLMAGRGTYVLGTIESGTVRLNDQIEVSGNGKSMLGTIKEIEINREPANEAGPNQYVGLILENIERSEVEAGMYVATPSKEALDAYNALLEENAAVLHPPRDNKVIETRYVIDLRNDEYIETKCCTIENIELIMGDEFGTNKIKVENPEYDISILGGLKAELTNTSDTTYNPSVIVANGWSYNPKDYSPFGPYRSTTYVEKDGELLQNVEVAPGETVVIYILGEYDYGCYQRFATNTYVTFGFNENFTETDSNSPDVLDYSFEVRDCD